MSNAFARQTENPVLPLDQAELERTESARTMALIVHGCYAASFAVGFTSIIAVVVAYLKRADAAGTIYESHLIYGIRTFWIGLALSLVAAVLCFVLIGFAMLPFLAIWFIVRIVRGFLAWADRRPISNPRRFF